MKFTKTFFTTVLLGTSIFSFQSTAWADLTEQQLDQGIEAVKKEDYQTALKLWEPLAEQGNVSAQFNLGLMYHLMYEKAPSTSNKVEALSESIKWYKKAAEQGNVGAQLNLADIYENSIILNYAEAMKLYEKLAEQGNPAAQAKLGTIYLDSRKAESFKIKRDEVKAKKFFKQACNNGVKEACGIYNYLNKNK
ncbi:tetratricopeptide repeat protein [Haemophilus haemolyticus]|jgi:Sel1 repeat protein|uniref:tetratricopeptide repeat protein n=1 Tax=Haemophilus haemolyticus TaxID=726 RepID=UPI000E59055F|nr:tetratricopeptide repeat protein [Haemophilus haemolyticus]MDU7463083.1 tetratricopeptide repeat protein [Haemophilus haemolyticus]